MQTWIIYGILASFFWGSYIIAAKVATSEKYFGINPALVSLFMLVGMAAVFVIAVLLEGNFETPKSSLGIVFSVLAGVLWALGIFVSIKALSLGASVSKLAPLYNTNTLVAVFLGIVLLKEIPNSTGNTLKLIIGAILIVVGAFLVSD